MQILEKRSAIVVGGRKCDRHAATASNGKVAEEKIGTAMQVRCLTPKSGAQQGHARNF